MIFSFELSMPNVGSWNGQWSGGQGGKRYIRCRNVSAKSAAALAPLNGNTRRNFYYSFGDGWGANVAVTKITSAEKRQLEKLTAGFWGYEWMIDSILTYGKILADHQKQEAVTA